MSESRGGSAWSGAESSNSNNMWWLNDPQILQQQIQAQHQQNLEVAFSQANQTPPSSSLNQMYTYKMANNFENNINNAQDNRDVFNGGGSGGGGGMNNYHQMASGGSGAGGGGGSSASGGGTGHQQPNWWGYHQAQGQSIHHSGSLQNVHNRELESLSRQQEVQRQEINSQHQEAVQRQQQAVQGEYRQHQAALQLHQQALAEAQVRQHQLQQQLHNNHHQVLQQLQPKGRMPKKNDSRPRGRMTAYAFFVQTCREEHKKKHPEENVVFAEFSKKCAERWKTMLDKEKKRFHEMAENDKKRYDTEMQNYVPPKGEKQRGKKRRQTKDPNAPKRSLSAFFWFSNDERGKVKANNPEYGVGDIAKELGRRWAEASSETRSKYEALADTDKARYEREMTAYKKKINPALQQQQQQPAVPEETPEDDDEGGDEEDDDD